MKRFGGEESGSAVVLILFILAFFLGGFIYTQINKVVVEIDNIVENGDDDLFVSVLGGPLSEDPAYRLQLWFFQIGVPILIIIGLSLWFVTSLRKARYQEL